MHKLDVFLVAVLEITGGQHLETVRHLPEKQDRPRRVTVQFDFRGVHWFSGLLLSDGIASAGNLIWLPKRTDGIFPLRDKRRTVRSETR